MNPRDYAGLMEELAELHTQRSPRSAALNRRAASSLIDGGSHSVRLIDPFPPRIVEASGAWLVDEDGHRILDLWQGHMANIMGHNPEIITSALAETFSNGMGLQTGLTERLQVEAAEVLCPRQGWSGSDSPPAALSPRCTRSCWPGLSPIGTW